MNFGIFIMVPTQVLVHPRQKACGLKHERTTISKNPKMFNKKNKKALQDLGLVFWMEICYDLQETRISQSGLFTFSAAGEENSASPASSTFLLASLSLQSHGTHGRRMDVCCSQHGGTFLYVKHNFLHLSQDGWFFYSEQQGKLR